MSIPRVKSGGWTTGERLTRAQINQLDGYVPYALDSRAGQTALIQSDNTFDVDASVELDGYLSLKNTENISIADGYLAIESEINGNYTTGELILTIVSGTYTLSSSQYTAAQHITIICDNVDTVTVVLPAIADYYKMISIKRLPTLTVMDDQKIIFSLGSGNTVEVYSPIDDNCGYAIILYCDGTNLYNIGKNGSALELQGETHLSTYSENLTNAIIIPEEDISAITNFPEYGDYPAIIAGKVVPIQVNNKDGLYIVNPNFMLGGQHNVIGKSLFYVNSSNGVKFEIDFSCGVQSANINGTYNEFSIITPVVYFSKSIYYDSNSFAVLLEPNYLLLHDAAVYTTSNTRIYGKSKFIYEPIEHLDADYFFEFKLYIRYRNTESPINQFPVKTFGSINYNVKLWSRP